MILLLFISLSPSHTNTCNLKNTYMPLFILYIEACIYPACHTQNIHSHRHTHAKNTPTRHTENDTPTLAHTHARNHTHTHMHTHTHTVQKVSAGKDWCRGCQGNGAKRVQACQVFPASQWEIIMLQCQISGLTQCSLR
jgi:hypothetical protein